MEEPFFDFRALDDRPLDPAPEEIAPPEDNPLNRWLRWGIRLAGSWTRLSEPALWTREFDYNPMVVYLTGRRRGQWVDDWIGLSPWILLTVAETVLGFVVVDPSAFGDFLRLMLGAPLFLAPFVGLLSMGMVVRYLSTTVRSISFEQLVVTRLSSAHILHGFVIRPLAIQTLGCLVNAAIWLPHVLAFAVKSSASPGALAYQVTAGFLLLLLRWTLFSSVIMASTAIAIRAFLFIRPARMASIRMVADWVRRLLVPATLLVALLGASIVVGLLAWMLVLGCVWILFYLVRLGFTAEEVLRWVAEHQAHWWVIAGEDQAQLPQFPWQLWRSLDPEFPDVPQP